MGPKKLAIGNRVILQYCGEGKKVGVNQLLGWDI